MDDINKSDALDKSVRVALAHGGDSTEDIVSRAEAFYAFLTKTD